MTVGFRVQAKQCATCIYKSNNPLNIESLESECRDKYGFFETHRQCHHSSKTPTCCRGFWDRHKDEFPGGQIAQRLNAVLFVVEIEEGEIEEGE